MTNYTYVLYFYIEHAPYDDEIIFLGSSSEPDLYFNALLNQYEVNPNNISIVSVKRRIINVWKNLVKAELSVSQEAIMNNAFMKGDNYSFQLKHMTLHLEKVQSFYSNYYTF